MNKYERVWIEISRANLKHNLAALKKRLNSSCEYIAVIKANAYGHGGPEIAKILNEEGIRSFAVASIDEAIALRHANIKGDILILGYTSPTMVNDLIKYGLTQSIVDFEYAKNIQEKLDKKRLKVEIQVDTGLHRLGFNYEALAKISEALKIPEFKVMGIYSHFACADSKDPEAIAFTKTQNQRFQAVLAYLKSEHIYYGKAHLQGSYGFLNYPEFNYDCVRIGMLMYGNDIIQGVYQKYPIDLKPVLSLKSHIIHLNTVKKGEYVSYGHSFKALKTIKIATIGIGYKDGYSKALAKDNFVYINGKACKIIGGICMDQMMVDVSDVDCAVDDEVELIGDHDVTNASLLAYSINSVAAEILAGLGRHIKRIII